MAAGLRRYLALVLVAAATAGGAQVAPSQDPPLLPPAHSRAIAAELSGSGILRTVQALSLNHRMRVSAGYQAAAETIRDRLAAAGLAEVEIIALPADGTIFYGTQRSRPAWNARFAELWEQRQENGRWVDSVRVASWADQPISLAQDSVSGRADAELVDIGAGTEDSDYAGKDLRGRLVLTSSQPEAVADRAIGRHGAAGIVSWAQNQRTAWWGEDESLVRWGHVETFGDHPTFAFMVAPAQARAWQARMGAGETVRLRAEVDAGRTPGAYLIPTAVIPGVTRDEEIVYSCHLDHPSPGANDNASGCSGILEIARTLNRLVTSGALPRPQRTIRFIWPAEVEGTIALLNARPEFARRTKATIHLDMIGGNPDVTRSTLRVYGSPPSLPSFVSDVGFAFGRYVNDQSRRFADSGEAALPLLDPSGSRGALQAEIGGFNTGSDHEVWAEGSWRVPVIYIADWPDRYIHTQRDLPGNLDPTKLRRAAFIAAASGWYLANYPDSDTTLEPMPIIQEGLFERMATIHARARTLYAAGEQAPFWSNFNQSVSAEIASLAAFGNTMPQLIMLPPLADDARPPSGPVYRRIRSEGPMDGFGYSWLDDQLERNRIARPALLDRAPDWPEAPGFGYEALNLVDGRRSVGEIREALAATVGAAPEAEVAEYLETLARVGVLERTGG